MKKSHKTALKIAGAGVAVAAVAAAASYITTKILVMVALDRNPPKLPGKAAGAISGSAFDNKDFIADVEKYAKLLENSEHELLEITAFDGTSLVGHYFKTPGAKRTVVCMHGWRSSWSIDFGMSAPHWIEQGCNLLIPEQRGQNNSGGDHIGFGLIERFDCLDWANYAAQLCPELPIYLSGVSMGASTVLMAAGLELPSQVKGIIADCGFTSPYAIWKHVIKNNLHMGFGIKGVMANAICKKRINFGADSYSTIEALQNSTVPVLLIHGDKDSFVPVDMSYENYEACTAPKSLLIVSDAEHGMSFWKDPEGYKKAVFDFWEKYDTEQV